jgi:arylsulfatase A-like enzyme
MLARTMTRAFFERCCRLMIGVVVIVLCSDTPAQQPNIVVVNIDDMGWGDFHVYGSAYSQTPNIDALASQGTRFTQFYTAAPICSPSRAGLLTGQYSARSGINSFLEGTVSNLARDNANNLSLTAPSMVRAFHDGGYATGHFGKWHMGGGRDVGYAVGTTAGTNAVAPRVVEYGYDQAWTQMEGLGNRIINVTPYGGNSNGTTTLPSTYYNSLNQQSEARGTGGGQDQLVYLERQFNADFMANHTIDFIDASRAANPNKPFFVNYWPDEVHTVNDPPAVYKAKYDNLYPNLPADQRNYLASLEHVDAQIGRIVDHIDQLGLASNTLILVTADNGAVQANADRIGSNGPFSGGKGDVFEGGVREPLIAKWTGHVASGRTDMQTVMWTPDLFPTLTQIAGVNNPANVAFDGENLSQALLGTQSQTRSKPLFWNMNRGTENRHSNPNSSGAGANGQEVLGVRNGNWKLMINAQGTSPELYDLSNDVGETTNRAQQNQEVVNLLSQEALSIRYSTPSRTLPDAVTPLVRLKAQDIASLGNGAAVGSWSDTAIGDSFNGSVSQATAANRPTLQTNILNGHAVVSFDGNDSLVSSSTNSLPTVGKGITVIAVANGDASGNPAQRLGQIGAHGGTSGKIVGMDMSKTNTSTSNGGAGFRFNNGASLYDTPIENNGFHIVTWQVDDAQNYADAKLLVDGTLPADTFTGTGTTSNTTSFSGSDLELILGTGRNASGALLTTDYYTGQLAEFLVFNDQLSIGQINLVANYLSTEYALPFAYETNVLFPQSALSGDFNHDGVVDATDYVGWRKDGTKGQQGLADWRSNFGKSTPGFGVTTPGSGLAAPVPESATWITIVIGATLLFLSRRSKIRSNHQLV